MTKDVKIAGIIPARYGSSRFPGKPLALIAGKTLINRTYDNAKRCQLLDEVYVVTDDKRIFDHVVGFGGKAVMTPSECPTGTERIAEAIKSENQLSDYDVIVNIQGDEPLLEPEVIGSVIEKLLEDEDASVSTAAVKISSEEEAKNYSVVKCVVDKNGKALYFSRTLIPNGHSGEWLPDVTYYKHLGIYGYRRDFILHYADLEQTPLQKAEDLEQLKVLENGYCIKVSIVESCSVGVDRPEDIKQIEQLL